jgi:uracil-DNA glycosylase
VLFQIVLCFTCRFARMSGLLKYFNKASGSAKSALSGAKRSAASPAQFVAPALTPASAIQSDRKRQKTSLTPDQKRLIETKRAAAFAKLQSCESSSGTRAAVPFQLTLNSLEPGWQSALKDQETKDYFKNMQKFLANEMASKKVYPPSNEIFAAFNSCPLEKVRVVIIGQDPYHGPGQAHGLCFSVKKGIQTPPSLRNIYKELHHDVGTPLKPTHGCLSSWCNQGVFLLNTSLTVRAGAANSHSKCGWDKFTSRVVKVLNDKCEGLVFLLWGKHAENAAASVSRKKHHVLTSSHPSPLGATKTKSPFIGSRCFSKTNNILEKQGGKPIDWGV